MKQFYTYMVECRDGSYYTGWTTDVARRVDCHNAGAGAKYTRSRLPVRLVYCETHGTKHDAMSREVQIKQLTHAEKKEMADTGKGAAQWTACLD